MDRMYDLYELMPDGSRLLKGCATRLEIARLKLEEFAGRSENEFYAIYTPTKETIARVNIGGVKGR
jgi:hypothetical protein